ncbi:MAG: deoxyguanosinetriphosphate triphosphohydrolase [Gammaproteobacteria bacterium]|nr:deoxyguanosinetriphosphate triphosphohydrolase [Gammaproteobacteria bacterium]
MSQQYETLAPYAADPKHSRGRRHNEPSPHYRSEFQRDRDRIIHCTAFRRLVYKTQVFVNHEGDLYRTRLTHSLEVAQIGRSVANALGLNVDLTEAICLAHDLGHTPFGHVGQEALNHCMRDYGGFEHNWQSLRIVDELEEKYANFPGLNLTFETREGILKHCSNSHAKSIGELGERFINRTQPGLEAQLANISDELAYNNHDVDDGLRSGLLSIEQLRQCELFRAPHDEVSSAYPNISPRRLIHEVIRRMIHRVISDLIEHSRANIEAAEVNSIADVRQQNTILIALGNSTQQHHRELKKFLRANLYSHPHCENTRALAKKMLEQIFRAFRDDIGQLPEEHYHAAQCADDETMRARVIADYIAGMTDRFAHREYERLFNKQAVI